MGVNIYNSKRFGNVKHKQQPAADIDRRVLLATSVNYK